MNNYLKREKEILDSIPPSRDEQVKKWLDSIKDKDMDYEKKYNKALAIARDFYNSTEYAKSHAEIKATYEAIFPELSESSDERIRKEILEYFEQFENKELRGVDISDWITWLEKQKEQKPVTSNNSRMVEAIINTIREIEKEKGWNCVYLQDNTEVKYDDIISWLNSFKPQTEQFSFSGDINEGMYDEDDWMELHDGIKMDRQGHIAGGLKLK